MERASSKSLEIIAPIFPTRSALASMSIHFRQVQTSLKFMFSNVTALDILILQPASKLYSLVSASRTLPGNFTRRVLCHF